MQDHLQYQGVVRSNHDRPPLTPLSQISAKGLPITHGQQVPSKARNKGSESEGDGLLRGKGHERGIVNHVLSLLKNDGQMLKLKNSGGHTVERRGGEVK